MASKKNYPAINYTARDFNSIKRELVDYAKRYYPNTFQDFNEAGFGALMLDTVSYVGDILSFYTDYNANESFLDTSIEYENILKHGRQLGYRFRGGGSSTGTATFYIIIPANTSGTGPDTSYIPVLKRGSSVSSDNGALFVLNEDVVFSGVDNDIVVARVNTETGVPTHFAIRAFGQIISGQLREEIITVGGFEKFKTIELDQEDIVEILSVQDSDGRAYFEVDYLSQDVIFRSVTNRDSSTNDRVPSLLKPIVVPRRFTSRRERTKTLLQFGAGSERDVTADPLIDPATTVLDFYSRDFVKQTSFDPANLLGTDKMGISPANTELRVVYRVNTSGDVNVSANGLNSIDVATFSFDDINTLDVSKVSDVRNSLEVSNEEPILGDVTLPTSKELKIRIGDTFSTQNRAVTALDYKSLVYQMPSQFGAVKRVNVYRDANSVKRNLNLYVISEDSEGNLVASNSVIKNNIKTWLNQSRMINDTIDIIDAKIVNVGIEFVVVGNLESNRSQVLTNAIQSVASLVAQKSEIGEPFFITDIYNILNSTPGVVDTSSVKVVQKSGGNYSTTTFDLTKATSPDGRFINVPDNVIMEVKFPNDDIRGSVK